MKIKGKPEPFELDEKRFYIPGYTLEGKCPKCKATYNRDFNDQYLSYPKANAPEQVPCYCGECEHEWNVLLRVNVSIEVVDKK